MERRRFLILRYPIHSQDLPRLLGKITLDYTSPLDNSVPDDPTSFTRGCVCGVLEETAVETWGSAEEGSLIHAALKPFTEVTYGSNYQKTYSMASSVIRTRTLQNHDKVFERIWEKHDKDILKLLGTTSSRLSALPEKMYIVIGYKTVMDATRTENDSTGAAFSLVGKIPVGAAAAAPTGGTAPANMAVQVSAGRKKVDLSGGHGTLVGETAVAVEYRKYERSCILAWTRRKSYGPIIDAGVKMFEGGRAMGGRGDSGAKEEEEGSGNDLLLDLQVQDIEEFVLKDGESDEFYIPKAMYD
ncbi:hypothetical protein ACJ41O_009041 [Fusarium nematophilum]